MVQIQKVWYTALMENIRKALRIAKEAHGITKDRGGADYIFHPIRVALGCETAEEKVVALLHDVVEDTHITLDDLRKELPPHIINAVDAITRREGETYEDFVQRTKLDPIARKVKILDLLDNLDESRMPSPATEDDMERRIKYTRALAELESDIYGKEN